MQVILQCMHERLHGSIEILQIFLRYTVRGRANEIS